MSSADGCLLGGSDEYSLVRFQRSETSVLAVLSFAFSIISHLYPPSGKIAPRAGHWKTHGDDNDGDHRRCMDRTAVMNRRVCPFHKVALDARRVGLRRLVQDRQDRDGTIVCGRVLGCLSDIPPRFLKINCRRADL